MTGRFVFAMLLSVTVAINAQVPVATAVVSGRVIETGSDAPVRRAIVTLSGGQIASGRSAVTDDEGRFSIDGLPAGDFSLEVTRPGFLKARYGASRPGRPGIPLSVTAGARLSDIAIAMTRGSALAGTVRDAAGDPGAGMRVEAVRIVHSSTGDRAENASSAIADDRGEYRIFGLAAGDYVLALTPSLLVGGMGDIGAPTEAEIDAQLNALRARTTLPTPGAPQTNTTPTMPADRGVATSATYYPGVVTSGEAVIVTLGASESREGLDFSVRLSQAASVDGVVTATRDVMISMIHLELQSNGPQLPVGGGPAGGPSVQLDNNTRTFRITNVPSGHYRLNARSIGAPGTNTQLIASGGALPTIDRSAPVLWGSVEFDVNGVDITGVTLNVQPAPTVAGRIVVDQLAEKPPATLAGVRVSLLPMPDSDRRSNGLSSPITAVAGADGAFTLPAVIPGSYRVSATLPSGWWLRSAVASNDDLLDGTLDVTADGLAGLALTMSDRHPGVGGTLTTASGAATEYFLVAFSADRTMWRAPSRRVRTTRPSTSGAFEVVDLPAGNYYLAVLRDLDPVDLDDPAFLETLIPAAASIAIEEGRRTVQDLRIGGYN